MVAMAKVTLVQEQTIMTDLNATILGVLVKVGRSVETYIENHSVVSSVAVGVAAHTPVTEADLVFMQSHLQRSPHLLSIRHL